MLHDTVVIEGEVSLISQIDGDPDVYIGGGGSQPTGTKSILLTEAGTKTEDVTAYAYAEINAVTSATASGAIASFSDGAEDVPMDSCVVNIEPVQSGSGDPSPINIRPISGWSEVNVSVGGKNLLPSNAVWSTKGSYRYVNGIVPLASPAIMSFTDKDTSVSLTGCYMGFVWDDVSTFVSGQSPTNFRWIISNGNVQTNCTNLSSQSGYYCQNLFIYPNTVETYNKIFARYDIQVEFGNTATAYEPYVTPTVYPVSLGQTVYGGTLDVVTGVLTVDRVCDKISISSIYKRADNSNCDFGIFTLSNTFPIAITYTGSATIKTAKGSFDAIDTIGEVIVYSRGSKQLAVSVSKNATLAEAQTLFDGTDAMYVLETPQTIQLTPTEVTTLLGSNNVWADSGDITVGYKADIYLYADSLETIIDTLTGGA